MGLQWNWKEKEKKRKNNIIPQFLAPKCLTHLESRDAWSFKIMRRERLRRLNLCHLLIPTLSKKWKYFSKTTFNSSCLQPKQVTLVRSVGCSMIITSLKPQKYIGNNQREKRNPTRFVRKFVQCFPHQVCNNGLLD
jgi:hypothetical protein